MDARGWVTQVAQVEDIAGELDGHIKALSSLVDRLMVCQRVMFTRMKSYGFGLTLDHVASLSRPSAARLLSRFVLTYYFSVSSFLRIVSFGIEADTKHRYVSRWLPPKTTNNTSQRSRSLITSAKRGMMIARAAGSGVWRTQGRRSYQRYSLG